MFPNFCAGVYIVEWDDHNVTTIGDITDNHGNLLNYQEFRQKYHGLIRTNFLIYQGICSSIRRHFPREAIDGQGEENNSRELEQIEQRRE